MNRVMLPCPLERELAEAMGRTLRAQVGRLNWRRFPDGEPLVTIDDALSGADVAIVPSPLRPGGIEIALRFATATVREFDARSVGLVAPYLAYMRQATRLHRGDAVSTPLFARFLEESFHWLAWQKLFDGLLEQSAAAVDGPSGRIEIETDYPRYAEA